MDSGRLILSRKDGEALVINDTIRVTVLERRGRRTRLMIEAPTGCRVDREEVHLARQAAKYQPAHSDPYIDLGGEGGGP